MAFPITPPPRRPRGRTRRIGLLLDQSPRFFVISAPVHFGQNEDTRKGNRPSFTEAARPELAEALYERFCGALEDEGIAVARGRFGARMELALVNDGPVTIVLET